MLVKQGRWALIGASILVISACSNVSDMTMRDKHTICPIIGGAVGSILGGGGLIAGGMIGGMVCAEPEMMMTMSDADADADGVADGKDACPNTMAGYPVDAMGCALDSDGDGVVDGTDECANTPAGASVDTVGCEVTVVMRETCGEFVTIENGEVVSFEPLYFSFDNYDLNAREEAKAACYTEVLSENPISVTLVGHTDDSGSEAYNQQLSQMRAQDAYDVLVAEGVEAIRLTAMGKGEMQPAASNDTSGGREMNRRVELLVD